MNEFGTMEDWDELLHEMHERNMKLMMDLVVNHTLMNIIGLLNHVNQKIINIEITIYGALEKKEKSRITGEQRLADLHGSMMK